MNYIEITLSDGTVSRWVIENDVVMDEVVHAIENIVGIPDTTQS